MRLLLKEDSKLRKVKYSPRLPDKYRFEEITSVLFENRTTKRCQMVGIVFS